MVNDQERAEISEAAASFLEAGIQCFERGDFNRAQVLLDAAEKLYRKTNDELSLAVVRVWHDSLQRCVAPSHLDHR